MAPSFEPSPTSALRTGRKSHNNLKKVQGQYNSSAKKFQRYEIPVASQSLKSMSELMIHASTDAEFTNLNARA